MAYPVGFEMVYEKRRSRLSTFFRWFLAIPLFFVLFIYEIGLLFAVVIAWFALMFTGKWPAGLYNFTGGVLRFWTRLTAYCCLGIDQYPPFGLADDPDYPVRVTIEPPLEKYSRVKVFFRPIYAILAYVIRYAMAIVLAFVSVLSWFAIVITGRQPAALQDGLNFALAYTTRADALMLLITETYPPFDNSPSADSPNVAMASAPMPPAVPSEPAAPAPLAEPAPPAEPGSLPDFES